MSRLLSILVFTIGCPDPPAEIVGRGDLQEDRVDDADGGGPGGDPERMDLSPGGTVLLDLEKVKVQQTQDEIIASGVETVSVSGELFGDCTGGTLRIDVIELGLEHTPIGPMIGPVTVLYPEATGPYVVKVPKGKNVQVAMICDVDKDQQIVQGTDKLAPGVALGELVEDKTDVVLAFPGERQAEVPTAADADRPGDVPPGDASASNPSATRDAPTEDEAADAEDEAADAEDEPADAEVEPADAEVEPADAEVEPTDTEDEPADTEVEPAADTGL